MRILNSEIFWKPKILVKLWDFSLIFCVWPQNIPSNKCYKVTWGQNGLLPCFLGGRALKPSHGSHRIRYPAACREKIPGDAQRRVCFVNEQVPWPLSNINVRFCTSRLCIKMLSFLFVCAWSMPRILYLSCGVPFPVWTPDNISGLISVVLWLLRWEVIKKM